MALLRRLAVVLALGLPAPPAAAELPAPAAAAMEVCLAPDLSLAERTEALAAAGFAVLPQDGRDAAAAALAPFELLFRSGFGLFRWANAPAYNAERLSEGVAEAQAEARRDAPGRWFSTAGDPPMHLQFVAIEGEEAAACALALPPGDWTEVVATALGVAGDAERDEPHLLLVMFRREGGPAQSLALMQYRPIAFGRIPTRPILLFPRVAMPE